MAKPVFGQRQILTTSLRQSTMFARECTCAVNDTLNRVGGIAPVMFFLMFASRVRARLLFGATVFKVLEYVCQNSLVLEYSRQC